MSTALLVGALLVTLLLIPIIGRVLKLLLVAMAVRGGLKDIGKQAVEKQPVAIHLSRRSGADWQSRSAVEKVAEPLLARGFYEAGDYSIDEMPGLLLRFLMKSEDSVYGCIYEHPKVGHWLDLVSRYQDGSGATFTSMRDRGMAHRPQDMVVHAPGLAPEAPYARLLRERPQRPLESLSPEGLVNLFEDAYREQMEWRRNRGVSAIEVVKVIATRAEKT